MYVIKASLSHLCFALDENICAIVSKICYKEFIGAYDFMIEFLYV